MSGQPTCPTAREHAEPSTRCPLRRRLWFRALVFLLVLYVAWCIALWCFQDRLLFPADMAPLPTPQPYSAATVELARDIEGGGRVVAWFVPAFEHAPDRPAPLVVFFHGNAEIIDHQQEIIEGYRRLGCSILLPEYRGYGRSDGRPGEEAIVDDALFFYDKIIDRPGVDRTRVVVHGRSLGGGPAAQVADRRKPGALILQSTFKSAAAMAHRYLAPSFLARNPFRTDRVLDSLDVPVLIFHGRNDDIIPVAHGRALRDIARRATYIEYDCRHNDFPGEANRDRYWGEIRRFLEENSVLSSKQHD